MRRQIAPAMLVVLGAITVPTASASIIDTTAVESTIGGVSVLNSYTWPSLSEIVTSSTIYALVLPKFDSTLGTLLRVTLTFASSANYNLTLTADPDGDGGSIDGTLGVTEVMRAPNASVPVLTLVSHGTSLISATQGVSTGGEIDMDPGEVFTASGNAVGPIGTHQFTAAPDLAVYQAAGGGTFSVLTRGRSAFAGQTLDTPFQLGGGAYWGAAVSVEYRYETAESVPEPATMSLMGGSFFLIGVFAYKRKRA
jgi:hypothetical protein